MTESDQYLTKDTSKYFVNLCLNSIETDIPFNPPLTLKLQIGNSCHTFNPVSPLQGSSKILQFDITDEKIVLTFLQGAKPISEGKIPIPKHLKNSTIIKMNKIIAAEIQSDTNGDECSMIRCEFSIEWANIEKIQEKQDSKGGEWVNLWESKRNLGKSEVQEGGGFESQNSDDKGNIFDGAQEGLTEFTCTKADFSLEQCKEFRDRFMVRILLDDVDSPPGFLEQLTCRLAIGETGTEFPCSDFSIPPIFFDYQGYHRTIEVSFLSAGILIASGFIFPPKTLQNATVINLNRKLALEIIQNPKNPLENPPSDRSETDPSTSGDPNFLTANFMIEYLNKETAYLTKQRRGYSLINLQRASDDDQILTVKDCVDSINGVGYSPVRSCVRKSSGLRKRVKISEEGPVVREYDEDGEVGEGEGEGDGNGVGDGVGESPIFGRGGGGAGAGGEEEGGVCGDDDGDSGEIDFICLGRGSEESVEPENMSFDGEKKLPCEVELTDVKRAIFCDSIIKTIDSGEPNHFLDDPAISIYNAMPTWVNSLIKLRLSQPQTPIKPSHPSHPSNHSYTSDSNSPKNSLLTTQTPKALQNPSPPTSPKGHPQPTQFNLKKTISYTKIQRYNSGQLKFKGAYLKDQRNGPGTYYYQCGDTYEGDFQEDLKEGKGVYVFNNGDKYDGAWVKDKQQGNGIYYFRDGAKYVGEFEGGLKSGKGILYYGNGDYYVGYFSGDLRHGQGGYKDKSDRIVYDGLWAAGMKHGQGTYNYSDTERYTGMWQSGKKHGQGTKTNS